MPRDAGGHDGTEVELHLLVHHFRDDTGGAVLDEHPGPHWWASGHLWGSLGGKQGGWGGYNGGMGRCIKTSKTTDICRLYSVWNQPDAWRKWCWQCEPLMILEELLFLFISLKVGFLWRWGAVDQDRIEGSLGIGCHESPGVSLIYWLVVLFFHVQPYLGWLSSMTRLKDATSSWPLEPASCVTCLVVSNMFNPIWEDYET